MSVQSRSRGPRRLMRTVRKPPLVAAAGCENYALDYIARRISYAAAAGSGVTLSGAARTVDRARSAKRCPATAAQVR